MFRNVGLVAMLLGVAVVPGSAQVLGTGVLPVTEVGPTAFNATVTAIESTVSAIEDVIQSAYMLLELTPLDDIALNAGEFAETIGELQAIAAEGTALYKDAQGAAADFDGMFSVFDAPSTPAELAHFMSETTTKIHAARRYAIRTQSLIHHIVGAVTHVRNLVALIGGLTGNMQGNQVQNQLLAQANQTLQTQTLEQAAAQRIRILEQAQRDVIANGWNKMQAQRWAGWPTTVGGQ